LETKAFQIELLHRFSRNDRCQVGSSVQKIWGRGGSYDEQYYKRTRLRVIKYDEKIRRIRSTKLLLIQLSFVNTFSKFSRHVFSRTIGLTRSTKTQGDSFLGKNRCSNLQHLNNSGRLRSTVEAHLERGRGGGKGGRARVASVQEMRLPFATAGMPLARYMLRSAEKRCLSAASGIRSFIGANSAFFFSRARFHAPIIIQASAVGMIKNWNLAFRRALFDVYIPRDGRADIRRRMTLGHGLMPRSSRDSRSFSP